MISRKVLRPLVVVAIILPMLALIALGSAKILDGLGDAPAAIWLNRITLVLTLLWLTDLALLLIALGINAAEPRE